MWFKSFVLGQLSFVTMPFSCNCIKMNEIQFWNCLPKLVHCTQWQPCGLVTQDGMTQNLGFLKMSNFDIYVVLLAFGAILGDPKFGSFHVGSPHHLAVTGYNELTLVVNCMNEFCSSSNNTVAKAFWRKKVLPEQRISYCAGIYKQRNLGTDFCIYFYSTHRPLKFNGTKGNFLCSWHWLLLRFNSIRNCTQNILMLFAVHNIFTDSDLEQVGNVLPLEAALVWGRISWNFSLIRFLGFVDLGCVNFIKIFQFQGKNYLTGMTYKSYCFWNSTTLRIELLIF